MVESPAEKKSEPVGTRVKWNVEQLKSSYVNFANANSTREEVVMNFGLNASWDRSQPEMEIELARTYIYKAAWLKDEGRPYSKEAAIAKLYATEMAERVLYDAIQIHGGYGYSREYNVERMYRDARLMTIGEGTSEIQRLVISRHVLAG